MPRASRVAELTERACRRCEETKSVEDFTTDRGLPTTLCRACNATLSQQRYAANREARKETERTRRAARKAIDSDAVAVEDCLVLGIPLRPVGTGRGDDCPEVDRLVPELGYVRGNVAIISHRANRMKSNGTAAELERVAAWMRSRGAR